LRAVAELYIPFRLFRVQIVNRGVSAERLVALDAVSGTLDLYQFEHLPAEAETVPIETRNCPSPNFRTPPPSNWWSAKLRRILYSRGFFRMRDLQITAVPLEGEIHIPYWLGFRAPRTTPALA